MIKSFLNRIVFVFLIIIPAIAGAQAPVINSFSPSSAPAGASVIISGNNFSTTATNNIVYFGGARANVTAATVTSLTAVVPNGSLYQPISVTVDSFTAFSNQPFITSFGSSASFQSNSFSDTISIAAASAVCFADFDNDGLADMVGNAAANRVAVYKNIGSPAEFLFTLAVSYSPSSSINQIIAKDFDGDGKLDIAFISSLNTWVTALRNTSAGNVISFDPFVSYGLASSPFSMDATDIDGDGKTDIVVGYQSSGSAFSVLRNTGSPGRLSFATRVNFAFGTVPGGAGNVGADNTIFTNDIDGDGKPDVTSMSRFFPPYLIYRNTSFPGTVSFAAKVAITSDRNNTSGNGAFDMKLGDIDGDGKPEIIHAFQDSSFVSLYRNTSSPGNISFGAKTNFPGPLGQQFINVNDMDGDSKADIVLLTYYSTCVIKNNSVPGNFSLDEGACYFGGFEYQQVTTADIDTDGKADIIISGYDVNNNNARRAVVLGNKIGVPLPVSICPGLSTTSVTSNVSGNNYQWQANDGNGFYNISDNGNYVGAATNTLTINSIPSSWYGYQFRCNVDDLYSVIFALKVENNWTGAVSNEWENPANWSCGKVPNDYTDVFITNGTPFISSNITVRSIKVTTGASLNVGPGYSLTVLH